METYETTPTIFDLGHRRVDWLQRWENRQRRYGDKALKKSSALVAELKETIQLDCEIFAEARDGVPVIRVKVEDPTSDYTSVVDPIKDAVGSFDGDLWLVFDREREVTESEKAAGLKDPREILARFNAKAGEKLP